MSSSEQYLKTLELNSLSNHGFENFADPGYRVEVAKRLGETTGSDHAIFFDDAAYALPDAQRPLMIGLPGYERATLPALLLAPGFKNGVSVVCAAPPNPVEMKNFKAMKEMFEEKMQAKTSVRLMYEQGDGLIDLMQTGDEDYKQLCQDYAKKMESPDAVNAYQANHHIGLTHRHAKQLLSYGERAYVSPFQSTEEHAAALQEFVDAGTVVLPDIPNMDKAYNNFLLKKEGLGEYVHTMMAVHADGTVSTDYDPYVEKSLVTKESAPHVFQKTDENMVRMANSMLDCTERLAEEGLRSIIKLDSNGVSGLGNLMPDENHNIYDQTISRQQRLQLLLEKMNESYAKSDALPQFAVVEEYIDDAQRIDGFKYDLTAGGMMIDGVFMPLSMFPFATDKDGVYDRGWIAAKAELVNENPAVWEKIFKAYARMGEVMAKQGGYRNGILAGDVLVRQDGRIVFHDYNFRRGGRSTPEALIALLPDTGLFEVQLKIAHEQGLPHVASNVELVDMYTKVCQELTDRYGIYPFSTAFSYFGWGNGTHPFMKLKLLVPTGLLEGRKRNEHIQLVQDMVTSLM